MRILVCGGRGYANRVRVFEVLDAYLERVAIIIHGCAAGADALAEEWAAERGIAVARFRPQYHLHGGSALLARNAEMVSVGRPDLAIAFPGGKGTKHMVMTARAGGIKVREIEYWELCDGRRVYYPDR